jgi:hypothetical protein
VNTDGFLIMFAAAEPPPATDSRSTWVSMILRELGRSQASGLIFDLVIWTLLGALLGVIISILACVLFSRIRWYDFQWRFARAVRWTVFVLTVVVTAALFSLVGFWSGAIQGSERVLSKSQLATDVFPKIADVVADVMAWVQVHATLPAEADGTNLSVKLDEFRAGKWELHAAQFLRQLDSLKEATITNAVAKLEQSALERTPQLKGGLSEKLLHQLLSGLGRLVVERKVANQLKSWGADRVYFAIREKLTTEAAKSGSRETIMRSEISQFLVQEGIVPGVMKPIRSTARMQQLPLVVIAGLVMVLPPLCIRLAKKRFGSRTNTGVAPSPPQVAA